MDTQQEKKVLKADVVRRQTGIVFSAPIMMKK
jgi:hypothetical protein